MNKDLFSCFKDVFLAGLFSMLLVGCSIGRRLPVVDYGKYRANVFFEFNKSTLSNESVANLDVLVTTIKQFLSSASRNKPRKVIIEVRGDASEEKTKKGKEANKRIKRQRAEIVAAELKKMIEQMGLDGVEISILDDEIVDDSLPEDEKKGYKRAIVDITFVEEKRRGIRRSQVVRRANVERSTRTFEEKAPVKGALRRGVGKIRAAVSAKRRKQPSQSVQPVQPVQAGQTVQVA